MSNRTKKHAQRHHAKLRALQRFGWTLNKHDLNFIAKKIRAGEGEFVERQSNRVTVWDIEFKGEKARVVYDSQRHQIVTFLPKEALTASSFSGRTPDSLSDNAGSIPADATKTS